MLGQKGRRSFETSVLAWKAKQEYLEGGLKALQWVETRTPKQLRIDLRVSHLLESVYCKSPLLGHHLVPPTRILLPRAACGAPDGAVFGTALGREQYILVTWSKNPLGFPAAAKCLDVHRPRLLDEEFEILATRPRYGYASPNHNRRAAKLGDDLLCSDLKLMQIPSCGWVLK